MKIIVTGPDGVLGSNLVRELLSRGYNVSVLLEPGKKSPTLSGLEITKFYGDILNPPDLNKAFKNQDIVIHCAAATSVFPARNPVLNRVNVGGTKNVIDAVLENNVGRLVYVGTANSFGFGDIQSPGKEGNEYISVKYGLDYMDSKRSAQEEVLKAVNERNLPAVIVNPTFMIGPYDSKPSSGAMIMALYNGKVPGYTSGGKNFISVKDVAAAIANAITMGRVGECYILGNENLSYKEAFDKMATAIGVSPPKRKLPEFVVKQYGAFSSWLAKTFNYDPVVTKELAIISCEKHYYSSDKALKELALPQTPLTEATKDCYRWFKENNYLKN